MTTHVRPEAVALNDALSEIIRSFVLHTNPTSPSTPYRGTVCPLELEARIMVAFDLAAREPVFEIPIPRTHITKAKSVHDSAIVEMGDQRAADEAKESHEDHCSALAENRAIEAAFAEEDADAPDAAAAIISAADAKRVEPPPFYERPDRSQREIIAERTAMTAIAQDILDEVPALYAVLSLIDDSDRVSDRPVNIQSTINQAIEWISTPSTDLATEVARRVIIAHLRSNEWAPDWARALYFPRLAARLEISGNDLPLQYKRKPSRKPHADQIVGLDAIAATIGRTPKTALRKILRGEIPAAYVDGEYQTRQAFLTVDRTRSGGAILQV